MGDLLNTLEKIESKAKKKPIEYENEKPLIIRIYEELTSTKTFRLNDISKKIEFRENNNNNTEWQMLQDEHINTFWIEFQLNKEFKGKEKPSDALLYKLINSHLTEKHNAIQEYFNSLQWDGKDYLQQLYDTITLEPLDFANGKNIATEWKGLFKQWLISAVACMLGRAPNHVMLLLSGGQGIGKTTWLNKLCPAILDQDYRVTGHINPDLKDDNTANFLAEKAFVNIDDQLDNIFAKDFNAIKSIITIDKINNRKKYARFETSRPRIANIVGSVNQERIFIDSENRRYLCFKVVTLDYLHKIDMDGLWAQIHHEYKQGARHYFSSEQINTINQINDQFAKIPPEQEYFNLCYEVSEVASMATVYVQFSEILSTLKLVSGLNMRENILTVVLKKMNIRPTSKRIQDSPRYVYQLREKFIRDKVTGKIQLLQEN